MSTNNNNNTNKDKNNNKDKQNIGNTNNTNDPWSESLKKNAEQRQKDSKWFNMQPGEKAVLQFLPEFGPVMKDFDGDEIAETLRYEYKVIDVNHREDGAKPWDVSKTWSQDIDYHLKQGHHILSVERVGSGKKTKYYFTPVAAANAASA